VTGLTRKDSFQAIGTAWNIELFGPVADDVATGALQSVRQRIDEFDYLYSRFRADSLVSEMYRSPGEYILPLDAKVMLDLYRDLYALSEGGMTPLIGQVLSDAGYDADYSLQPGVLQSPPSWEEALDYAYPNLTVKQPVLLDLGALGKGYLVDLTARALEGEGLHHYCIDAGGDVIYNDSGGAALDVALEHPTDPTLAVGVATIHNQSLCGSAGNRRAWDGFNHIIDPRTLRSPQHLSAVWATAETAVLADALTTALYFVSPEKLAAQYTFEYAMLDSDHRLQHSEGFPARFFVDAEPGA
jgi:thiamine biosynthesis lipoprotein